MAAAAAFPKTDGQHAEEDGDSDEDEYEYWYPSPEEELKIANEALSGFPKAAALGSDELEAAAIRLVEQSKPENYACPPGQVRTRLSHSDIWLILALKQDKPKDDATRREYLDSLESMIRDDASRGAFPEGWLEERKQDHLEMLPFSKKCREDFQAFQAKVRSDLIHKGFVEVDKNYWEKGAKMDELYKEEWEHIEEYRQVEEWKRVDLGRIKISKPE